MIALLASALLAAAAASFTAEPPALQPVPGARARLSLELPGAGAEAPRLSASVGTIENLRALGEDRFSADYLPPDEAVPQVALLAAVSKGEVRFLALPLYGLGDAEVKTRPGGRISVRIGEQRFGPVWADARGIAEVPVVVPPGVAVAFHGAEAIDLHVPPSRLLHLALVQAAARADREAELEARVLVIDARGAPRTGARLLVRASEGQPSAPVELGEGLYSIAWRLQPGRAQEETLSVRLEGAPAFVAQAKVQRPAGPAATLVLRGDREALTAGEGLGQGASAKSGESGEAMLEMSVHATLRDAAGNPAEDGLLVLATPGDTQVTAQAAGDFDVRVTVPSRFGGATLLQIEARARRGPATARLAVPLQPAPPARARIESARKSVHADGSASLPLRVLVADRFDNPVPDARVEPATDAGEIAPAPDAGPAESGSFAYQYRPPLLREGRQALVKVRAGAAEGTLQLQLAPAAYRLALTPKLGALSNFGRVSSPLAALEASVRFDLGPLPCAALAEAGWFFSSHTDQPAGAPAVSTRDDFLVLSAGLSARPMLGDRTQAFFSASPSLTLLRSGQQFAGQPKLTESAVAPGLLFEAGLEHRFGRFVPLVAARFSFTGDPSLATLQGPLRGFALVFGSRFETG